jgi:hypothetical protein
MLAFMITFVFQILHNTIRAKDNIREDLEGPKLESAVLDELIRDLRFVYFRPGQLGGDAGFVGRNRTASNGRDGDRLDFLTCRRSRMPDLDDTNQAQIDSPIVEVGWACRTSDEDSRLLELWRREDYFVDDQPTDGGKFHKVCDRIFRFNLQYYPPGNERDENDPVLEEWDSTVQHKLPYAIVVSLEYYVQTPSKDKDLPPGRGTVRRIILLTPARTIVADAPAMDTGMTAMR